MKFGASGNPLNFFKSSMGKDKLGVVEWSHNLGLNAQERQMTYGARMHEEDAIEFGKRGKKFDVFLSVHAAYYIVLTSDKEKVVKNSISEMLKTLHLASLMDAKRIIFHPGFGTNTGVVIKHLKTVEKDKPKGITIHPETMGKLCQLGSLNDIITICENTESLPCIDFGHLYARSLGTIKTKEDYRKVLMEIEKRLGKKVLNGLHCHFYPVDFTDKGEKKHRAVTEKKVLPVFSPLGELIKEFNMSPVLISESRDSQDIGALQMKEFMNKLGVR